MRLLHDLVNVKCAFFFGGGGGGTKSMSNTVAEKQISTTQQIKEYSLVLLINWAHCTSTWVPDLGFCLFYSCLFKGSQL